MSAYVDQDQVVKFYYGNALRDLKDFLPPEEAFRSPSNEALSTHQSASHSLEATLSSVESLMSDLQGAQRELSYLVQDLGRMMKRVK